MTETVSPAQNPPPAKTHRFEVDVTITEGVPTTPMTFNLRVASISGLEVTEGGKSENLHLIRAVSAGDDEFFRWADENWTADMVVIMDEIRFLIQGCTASYLYYGELGKTQNGKLKEILCLNCTKVTASYQT